MRPSRSPTWTRTKNLRINSALLCQLSYRGLLKQLVYFIKGFAPAKTSAHASNKYVGDATGVGSAMSFGKPCSSSKKLATEFDNWFAT